MSIGTYLGRTILALSALAGTAAAAADDKCVSQCDDQSDKCMQSAGQDGSKQKQCDANYEECLRACN